MENASLVGLSRQVVLRRDLDIIANNVANLDTPGFRGEALLFDDFLMPVARDPDFARPADQRIDFVLDAGSSHDFAPGAITQTGNPLDVALQGDAWFVVDANGEERYTRAGNFTVDAGGRLVTAGGLPVMSEGGPISFGPGETDVTITPEGTVSSSAGVKGRLRLAAFDDNRVLSRIGDNLFAASNDAAPIAPAGNVRIVQGALEQSNVDGVIEMTRLIAVTRAYEQLSRLLQSQDELRDRAIGRLGRLQG